jgi:restriction endonuclease S subunit
MEWPLQKLQSLCDVFTDGDWIESKNQSTEGVRLVQTGNVGIGKFKDRRDKARFISEATFKDLKCCEIHEGDCLVSRLPDPVGRSCILPKTGEKMITAVDCTILRFNKDKMISEFFNYFSQSSSYLICVESLTSGATRKRISRKNLGLVEIPTPPIPEQKRIVALLDTVFTDLEQTRTKTEQNLKNAYELMDVTFKEAITGKLTRLWREANQNVVTASESLTQLNKQKNQFVNEKVISKEKVFPGLLKEEAPYQLPESWLWCRLGEIGNATNYPFVDGPFGSSINTKTDYIETGVPVLRMVNVKPFTYKNYNLKYVNEDKYQQFTRHNVLPGDVLFSKVGAGTGESCVVPDDFLYGMLSTTGITRIRVGQVVLNQYLCCFLNSNIKTFMALASKAAQPFLNMTQIKTFPFPLPPIEEQSEIVLILERLSTEIQQVEAIYKKKLLALDELKKSILQKAFSGELTKAAT